MGALTIAAVGEFARKNWAYFALAALIAILLTVAYCSGGARVRSAQDRQTIKTQQHVGTANEKAATTRVDDQVKIEQQKQEINNAISAASNSDDARRRSGCAILRQQGRDTASIPACR